MRSDLNDGDGDHDGVDPETIYTTYLETMVLIDGGVRFAEVQNPTYLDQ